MNSVQLDLKFWALICTRCQYALVPGTIDAHLATAHEEQLAKAIQQHDLPVDTLPIPNLAFTLYLTRLRHS